MPALITGAAPSAVNSDTSAPAANAFSPPVTTTAFTDASAVRSPAMPSSSRSNAVDSGLSGGRLRRSSVTPSGRDSTRTRGSDMRACSRCVVTWRS